MSLSRRFVYRMFRSAGIRIVESGPEKAAADVYVAVHDRSFYRDVMIRGSLGFGNAYMDGKWDSPAIDQVTFNILSSGIYQKVASLYDFFRHAKSILVNLQTQKGARKVNEKHYDLPSQFYAAFLDPYFQYTCGYFSDTDNLNQSQINKMHLICSKLGLKSGQNVLDIGGGWGGLARFMVEHYRARPVVVTLSKEQAKYIRTNHASLKVVECDYREIRDKLKGDMFDAVTAVGILEHVGHKNYTKFMNVVDQSLIPGGKFLLQTIFTPSRKPEQNPWVEEHVFPNSELPTRKLVEASARPYFTLVKTHGFQDMTPHYRKTALAWIENLNRAVGSGTISLSRKEHRKWQYYFLSYAGAFKAEHARVAQFLYEK